MSCPAILLSILCCFLTACMVRPAKQEMPEVELTSRVTKSHVHLQATIHSRSEQAVALVDHEAFVRMSARPKTVVKQVIGCRLSPPPRARWKQVNMLPAGKTLTLETSIPYEHGSEGWVLNVSEGSGVSVTYVTQSRRLQAVFRYSADRSFLPWFWWLSGKRFIAAPLEASQHLLLKPLSSHSSFLPS